MGSKLCPIFFFGLIPTHENVHKGDQKVCAKCGLLQEQQYDYDGEYEDSYWEVVGVVDNPQTLIAKWDQENRVEREGRKREQVAKEELAERKRFKEAYRQIKWEDV